MCGGRGGGSCASLEHKIEPQSNTTELEDMGSPGYQDPRANGNSRNYGHANGNGDLLAPLLGNGDGAAAAVRGGDGKSYIPGIGMLHDNGPYQMMQPAAAGDLGGELGISRARQPRECSL